MAPIVSAGADVPAWGPAFTFNRTATENQNGGGTITARAWTIESGPIGTGTTIGTAAALAWPPGSSPVGTTDIRQPVIQEMCYEIVSTAENSTLDWQSAYDYIEDIDDDRGYTGGLIGFTSATGDMLELIDHYLTLRPTSNPLASFRPGLVACASVGFGSGASAAAASNLGPTFLAAWANAANTDDRFRQAQRDLRKSIYWDDALTQALADGVGPLGLALHYDILVNHGVGEDSESYGGILAAARASSHKPPSAGGSESAYLIELCDLRDDVLIGWGDYQSDGRSTIYRALIAANKFSLLAPFSWSVYGEDFTIPVRPAVPTDSIIGTYVLRYSATNSGGTGADTMTIAIVAGGPGDPGTSAPAGTATAIGTARAPSTTALSGPTGPAATATAVGTALPATTARSQAGGNPQLVTEYAVNSGTTSAATAQATPSFTPAPGEIIVVKVACALSITPTPSGGGLTYRLDATGSGVGQSTRIYTAQVGSSPTAMTVSVAYSGASIRDVVVERWTSAARAATPATNATKTGTGAPSATVTTTAAGSVVTWVNADDNESSGTVTYRSSATQQLQHLGTGLMSAWHARQTASAAGAQTIGMTAPASQAWTMVGIELLAAGAAVAGATRGDGYGAARTPSVVLDNGPAGNPPAATAVGAALAPTTKLSSAVPIGRADGVGTAHAPTVLTSASAGVPVWQTSIGPYHGGPARLSVEVAWGADLHADPATWDWSNITHHVLQTSKITITHGRADEADKTQPANCGVVLDNRSGAYSLGPQSPNYPNVRRNTPIRVRVDPGTGIYYQRFVGFANGWTPTWDQTGNHATVALSASGSLRRMSQGDSPKFSALRRFYRSLATVVAYWPLEDGDDAKALTSEIPGVPAATYLGQPKLAASGDRIPGSDKLLVIANASITGSIPPYAGAASTIRFLAAWKDEGTYADDFDVLAVIQTSGTLPYWEILFVTTSGSGPTLIETGKLGLIGYNAAGTIVVNQQINEAAIPALRGSAFEFSFEIEQVGPDMYWRFAWMRPGAPSYLFYNAMTPGQTAGRFTGFTFNPSRRGTINEITLGHVVVHNSRPDLFAERPALNAHYGEDAVARVRRVCAEADVPVTVVGTSNVQMGPQPVADVLAVLRECETADQGLLHDGRAAGLTYVARSVRENPSSQLVVDANGQLVMPFAPTDDDQRNRNRITATRRGGASATVEDSTGPMGVAEIGVYDSSITVNTADDIGVVDYAGWLVHLGTVEGYRYPSLTLDLARNPELVADWLAMTLSARMDVANIEQVRAQHEAGTLSSVLEGYTESIDQFRWDVTANLSDRRPWKLGTIAANSGDTSEDVLRLVGEGSSLAATALPGATTLSVATPAGPLWTTAADDFPLYLEIYGVKVTVTGVAGASSPQTFTVAALPVRLPAGALVELWQPATVGI